MRERRSNLELARIISMAAIVMWHLIFHGIFQSNFPNNLDLSSRESIITISSLFLCFGTNLFILISGYFGISLSWKGILNLWVLTTSYNLLNVFINGPITLSAIFHACIISSTEHWFFQAYLWLMIASPLINAGIQTLDRKNLTILVILGGILCCISGWFFENDNSTGHNALQLFYVYSIGRFININEISGKITKAKALLLYFIMCICAAVLMIFYQRRGLLMHTHHNNPFILFSSIAVFLYFSKLSIQSKTINFIAKSVPAVLLLSDLVFSRQIYSAVYNFYLQNGPGWKLSIFMIVCVLAIFALSVIIDMARRLFAWLFIPSTSTFLSKTFSHLERII